MKYQKHFFLYLALIPAIAALAAFAEFAGIKTHFYIWEVLLDGKTFLLGLCFIFLLKPAHWRNDAIEKGVFRWSIIKSAGAFLIPVLLSCAIAGAGLFLKKVTYADPENGATLLLTMVFDIPAIFIFSVTTVFVEEYIFRGTILAEFERNNAAVAGLVVTSILWAVYAGVDVFPLEEFTWTTMGILLLFYCSVGITSGVLFVVTRSVWVSYAFRIGIITITPSILLGVAGVTDAFFSTESNFFFGDGIITSSVLIAVFLAIFFAALHKRKRKQVLVL
jgi:membrane protease YdiL (CAAX protease family)